MMEVTVHPRRAPEVRTTRAWERVPADSRSAAVRSASSKYRRLSPRHYEVLAAFRVGSKEEWLVLVEVEKTRMAASSDEALAIINRRSGSTGCWRPPLW